MTEQANGATVLVDQPTPPTQVGRGTCQNCRFGQFSLTADSLQLTCKEDSPKIIGNVLPMEAMTPAGAQTQLRWFTQACWPVVDRNEWCGRWQQDPIKHREQPVEKPTGIIQPS